MSKNEASTDLWVYNLLKEVHLGEIFTPQGSNVAEIDNALKTASKKGTGKVGRPEFVGVVKDFVIIIEDKATVDKHIKRDKNNLISQTAKSATDYAVNGALHYGLHIAKNTNYKKVIAIGISGNEKVHKISPIFINERGEYEELTDLDTLVSFSENNIIEYYTREILKEETNVEKTTTEILKDAETLHNDLRNYGNIEDKNKPLIVSGILLALREIEHGFSIDSLTADNVVTDGQKIYNQIENNLRRANVSPEIKKDKLLSQFSILKDNTKINIKNKELGKTPVKYFTEFLYESIFQSIRYNDSAEDYLGRFYGEFMSYSGGDGQNLGIVLTPKHITELFCDLLELEPTDKVLDPCTGTAGFLIASMHDMVKKAEDETEIRNIKKNQLFGIEEQAYMFTIATTNMILRGDGKSNLENKDFLKEKPSKLQLKGCNVGMMNPPYSMGSKNSVHLYEINFTKHLLESITPDGKVAVIVPQSTFTGKTKDEQSLKEAILDKHTLEGVITLNKNTFYGVGVNPCIAIFTAGVKHPKNKLCKFINFENDGYKVAKHIGLVETVTAKDKKQHLLDVWLRGAETTTKFCVETTVEATDEWLHSFYYFNDEIPTEADFQKTIADYLTFEVNMITHGRGYLFEEDLEVENED